VSSRSLMGSLQCERPVSRATSSARYTDFVTPRANALSFAAFWSSGRIWRLNPLNSPDFCRTGRLLMHLTYTSCTAVSRGKVSVSYRFTALQLYGYGLLAFPANRGQVTKLP